MLIEREPTRKPKRKMPTGENKPKLAMQQVPVFRVHYTDLEKFIHAVFGFEFDFLFAAGVTEKTGVEYIVTGSLPTPAWEQKATELRHGRRSRSVPLILAVLAHDQYMPIGRYTVLT